MSRWLSRRGWSTFDRSLEEAALDLGRSPFEAFRLVTLPIIAPAVISGWLLAFTLSLDDLVIASFAPLAPRPRRCRSRSGQRCALGRLARDQRAVHDPDRHCDRGRDHRLVDVSKRHSRCACRRMRRRRTARQRMTRIYPDFAYGRWTPRGLLVG